MSVWIIESFVNTAAAKEWWKQHPNSEHVVTTFKQSSGSADFADLMDNIELHHGGYSQKIPFRELQSFGFPLTEEVERVLSGYGFVSTSSATGFIATRSSEPDAK